MVKIAENSKHEDHPEEDHNFEDPFYILWEDDRLQFDNSDYYEIMEG